jgi:predicted nucleotidyltransferase
MQTSTPSSFKDQLLDICAGQQVHLLYACESGSRGWGFPSPDSDYDVRFIYLRPLADYLSIATRPDQIDLPITAELDVKGWDLRKVLSLLGRSNVTPFEWLQSPVVYAEAPAFRNDLWTICEAYFNPRVHIHHYLGLASGTLKSLDSRTIGIKKLFYILRPLLAARWCLVRGCIAPMALQPLMSLLPEVLRSEVTALVQYKAGLDEHESVTISAALKTYLETTLEQTAAASQQIARRTVSYDRLDTFFYQTLTSYDSSGT